MAASAERFEHLFTEDTDEQSDIGKRGDVLRYRVKTITSGQIIEVEAYPLWRDYNTMKEARSATTSEAQQAVNDRNAQKKLIRLINTNFDDRDLAITLTYKGGVPDQDQARKDIRNYLRRIKTYRKKLGLEELKYVYVIEYEVGAGGRKKKRVHHHVIMSGMDRDMAEAIWAKGYANARKLQPDEYGMEAIARYMLKAPRGGKRWGYSRNLKKPKVTTATTKVSVRQMTAIARDIEDTGHRVIAKRYPNCHINDIKVKRSDYVPGVYLYAHMKKEDQRKRGGACHAVHRASNTQRGIGAAMAIPMGGIADGQVSRAGHDVSHTQ